DTPSYGNNDVMSVPLSPFFGAGDPNAVKPKRWTHDMARAVAVKTKEAGGQIYAVWAGVDGAFWPWQLSHTPMSFFVVKLPPE
ncbi:MAG TPA: hypothetical protein VJX91_10015, partial [Candidatus Eisenbacteria bacterium]|nr:hypothetical protein [Candidatus Eisenbacteria bacterium]